MCDVLCALPAASAGGSTLFAKNSDRPPGEAQRLEWHPPRRDAGQVRATYIDVAAHPGDTLGVLLSRPFWMWGAEHGVNEAGVAAGNETIYTTLDPRRFPPALTGMDLVRLALERAASAEAATDVLTALLERYGQGGSGYHGKDVPYWSSFLIADGTDAWVVETSGTAWAAERVARTRAISNRTTIPAFDAEHRHPRQPVERLVDPRWRASCAVLAAEPVDEAALVAHLRSHAGEDGWTVCMHAGGDQATTASVVARLDAAGRPLASWCAGWPCRSVFVPLYVGHPIGEPVPWERFAALRPEERPPLDELERSLLADCSDSADWPHEAWRRVDDALGGLGR
jgi:secernin